MQRPTGNMTDSKYFTTTKKGEIFELKSELNSDKKEKKKEAVKKVIASMTVGECWWFVWLQYAGCVLHPCWAFFGGGHICMV